MNQMYNPYMPFIPNPNMMNNNEDDNLREIRRQINIINRKINSIEKRLEKIEPSFNKNIESNDFDKDDGIYMM